MTVLYILFIIFGLIYTFNFYINNILEAFVNNEKEEQLNIDITNYPETNYSKKIYLLGFPIPIYSIKKKINYE